MYPVDVDHLSLEPETPPPAARRAVGWHRLAERNGELWAVDVEWTDEVRPGLTARPPAWRYFSPAYDVNPKTGEIVGYTNLALTNNPATWGVTALASTTRGTRMPTMDEVVETLREVAKGSGKDAEEAARMLEAYEQSTKREARRDALRATMGLETSRSPIRHEGTSLILGAMTPAQARAHLARMRVR